MSTPCGPSTAPARPAKPCRCTWTVSSGISGERTTLSAHLGSGSCPSARPQRSSDSSVLCPLVAEWHPLRGHFPCPLPADGHVAVSTFWWLTLLGTFVGPFLHGRLLSFLLGKYLEAPGQGNSLGSCPAVLGQRLRVQPQLPWAAHLLWPCQLVASHRWAGSGSPAVPTCVSLVTSDSQHLCPACQPFTHLTSLITCLFTSLGHVVRLGHLSIIMC